MRVTLAARPPRLSAGRDRPDDLTSDTLCRASALPQEPLSRVRCRVTPSFVRERDVSAAPGPPSAPLGLGVTPPARPGCLPSDRLSTIPAERGDLCDYVFRSRVEAPRHPFTSAPRPSPSGIGSFAAAIQRSLGSPLGSPRARWQDASHRLLQPTRTLSTPRCRSISRARPSRLLAQPRSAADLLAAAWSSRLPFGSSSTRPKPDRRGIPSAGAGGTTKRRKTTISGNPAPGESSSDVEPPASTGFVLATLSEEGPCLAVRGTLAAAFSTAREVGEPISDVPCHLPSTHVRRCRALSLAGQNRFPHRRVNDDGFPGPGRLPSTSAPKGTRHSSATLPPRDELPTRVHPGSLSRSRARPLGRRRLFACGAPTGHVPLADFCNRNDPRARPTISPNPAHPA